MATESSIKDAIMLSLKGEGMFACRVGSSPYQRSGCPDILGVYRGFLIGIEVKTPEAYKKKDRGCTPNQVLFMNRMEDNGALVMVVCSVEQVRVFLAELKLSLQRPSPSELT
jgi:Holliday junction resolvase